MNTTQDIGENWEKEWRETLQYWIDPTKAGGYGIQEAVDHHINRIKSLLLFHHSDLKQRVEGLKRPIADYEAEESKMWSDGFNTALNDVLTLLETNEKDI